MASIDQMPPGGDLRAHCMTLDEPELLAQQLVQEGAIHALTTLLEHGCTAEAALAMLGSLHDHMALVTEVALAKGFTRLFKPGGIDGVKGGAE